MKKLVWMLAVLLVLPVLCRADSSIARVDGKQFPLIMFNVPGTDAAFTEVHDMGCDYVHRYGLTNGPVTDALLERIQAYLDLAQKHHLKVALDLDGVRRTAAGELGEMQKEMQKIVHRFKDHPALGFWYLYDEPNVKSKKISPADLLHYYQMIKQESPDIPVCVLVAVSSKKPGLDYMWSDFGEDYDILSFDTYPIRGEIFPAARLQKVTDFHEKALALGKPVMPMVQIFNPTVISYYVKQAEKNGQSTTGWRYPNLQELRYWNFASLAQGARGMIYWSYTRSRQTDPTWMDRILKPATLEFREFTDLVQPANQKEVLNTGAEKNLFFVRWKRGTHQYIVLVNGEPATRSITDSAILRSLNIGKLQPWKFTRVDALRVKNGQADKVNLQPWEVAVWEIL